MNIFILDTDPVKCAKYHSNKHVVKMILETAQMLSSAHRILGEDHPDLYRLTHKNHPCTKWVCESIANYNWAYSLFEALEKEYEHRYNKQHLSWKKLHNVLKNAPSKLNHSDLTPFALAMPDQYKHINDPVQSYRSYYIGEKSHIFQWKNRPVPYWVTSSATCLENS